MDSEHYNIDISSIKDSDQVCWEYTTEPPLFEQDEWKRSEGDIFCKLSPITQALAVSSDFVHLDHIKPSNILEWYYRLDALFDAGVGFMFVDSLEGEIPIRMTINDLKDHIGLKIITTNWDKSKFDKSLRTLRMQLHLKELLM
tara:strand:- start:44 stop:472 length:429 start_codon:yes stop_codon:yes gene_type:complete